MHLPIYKRNMGPGSCSPTWFHFRTPPKLLQIPSPSFGSLDLTLDRIARIADGENCPDHLCCSMVFSELTQGTGVWMHGLRGDESCSLRLSPIILILHVPVASSPAQHHPAQFTFYLHSEESNAGQQIHCRL